MADPIAEGATERFLQSLMAGDFSSLSTDEAVIQLNTNLLSAGGLYASLRISSPNSIARGAAFALFKALENIGLGRSSELLVNTAIFLKPGIIEAFDTDVYTLFIAGVMHRGVKNKLLEYNENRSGRKANQSKAFHLGAPKKLKSNTISIDPLSVLGAAGQAVDAYHAFVLGFAKGVRDQAKASPVVLARLEEILNGPTAFIYIPAFTVGLAIGVHNESSGMVNLALGLAGKVQGTEIRILASLFDKTERSSLKANAEKTYAVAEKIGGFIFGLLDLIWEDEDAAEAVGQLVAIFVLQDSLAKLKSVSGNQEFAKNLGVVVAPIVIDLILSLVTGGGGVARRTGSILSRLSGARRVIIKRLIEKLQNLVRKKASQGDEIADLLASAGKSAGKKAESFSSSPVVGKGASGGSAKVLAGGITRKRLENQVLSKLGKLTQKERKAISELADEDWDELIIQAQRQRKSFKAGSSSRTGGVNALKGYVHEAFITSLDEFQSMLAVASKRAKKLGFDPNVKHTSKVADVVNNRKGDLSDGVIYATKSDSQEILILGVIEGKSKNFRELAKKSGSIQGQIQQTLARLETGDIFVDGSRLFEQNISLLADYGRKTPWLAVVPPEVSAVSRANLLRDLRKIQGRAASLAISPIRDATAKKIAMLLIKLVTSE